MLDYKGRNKAFIDKIVQQEDLKAALIFGSSNILYLSGTDAASVLIVSETEDTILLTPRLEYLRALEEKALGKVYAFSKIDQKTEYEVLIVGNLFEALNKVLSDLDLSNGNLGIVPASLSKSEYEKLVEKIGVKPKDISNLLKEMRVKKDDEELKIMKKAVRIAEEAMRKAIDTLDRGVTESEVIGEIVRLIYSRGSLPSFTPIVAFGEHSAHPHAKPSLRELRHGDLVKIDLGVKIHGYCSDITRTIVFGNPSEKQKEIHNLVLEAQQAAINSIKPGIKARELHNIALKVFDKAGVSSYFNHGLGHGIGIDVHEPPSISNSSEDILEPGMVFTVEPGLYLRGYGGVRIEDMVVVEEDGFEILTEFERSLLV